jgi:hypothetical protein
LQEVVCRLSNEASDVRCAVCGQGFLVYWARFSRAEQAQARRAIQEVLRGHHAANLAIDDAHSVHPADVHPTESFSVMDPSGVVAV